MKILALIALVLACSCNTKSDASPSKPTEVTTPTLTGAPAKATPDQPKIEQDNMACTVLLKAEPKAACTGLYANVGSDHLYSAIATMPDDQVLDCTYVASPDPMKNFSCLCRDHCKTPPAPSAPTPPAPTPPAPTPPAPAPAAAPTPTPAPAAPTPKK